MLIALAAPTNSYVDTVVSISLAEYLRDALTKNSQVTDYTRDKAGDFIVMAISFLDGTHKADAFRILRSAVVGYCDETSAPYTLRLQLMAHLETAENAYDEAEAKEAAAPKQAPATDRKNMN